MTEVVRLMRTLRQPRRSRRISVQRPSSLAPKPAGLAAKPDHDDAARDRLSYGRSQDRDLATRRYRDGRDGCGGTWQVKVSSGCGFEKHVRAGGAGESRR